MRTDVTMTGLTARMGHVPGLTGCNTTRMICNGVQVGLGSKTMYYYIDKYMSALKHGGIQG